MPKKVSKTYHKNISAKQIKSQRKWLKWVKRGSAATLLLLVIGFAVRTFAYDVVYSVNVADVTINNTIAGTTKVVAEPSGKKTTANVLEVAEHGDFYIKDISLNKGIYEACYTVEPLTTGAQGSLTVLSETGAGGTGILDLASESTDYPLNTYKDFCAIFSKNTTTTKALVSFYAPKGSWRVSKLTIKTARLEITNKWLLNAADGKTKPGTNYISVQGGTVVSDVDNGTNIQAVQMDGAKNPKPWVILVGSLIPDGWTGYMCFDIKATEPAAVTLELSRMVSGNDVKSPSTLTMPAAESAYVKRCVTVVPQKGVYGAYLRLTPGTGKVLVRNAYVEATPPASVTQ